MSIPHEIGRARWIALGLAGGLVAAVLLARLLIAGDERGRMDAAPVAAHAERVPEPLELERAAPRGVGSTRQPVTEALASAEFEERVRGATEALVLALADPGFDDALWQREVNGQARTLGHEALPALRAVLADRSRSVEEHVAASELVAALER